MQSASKIALNKSNLLFSPYFVIRFSLICGDSQKEICFFLYPRFALPSMMHPRSPHRLSKGHPRCALSRQRAGWITVSLDPQTRSPGIVCSSPSSPSAPMRARPCRYVGNPAPQTPLTPLSPPHPKALKAPFSHPSPFQNWRKSRRQGAKI